MKKEFLSKFKESVLSILPIAIIVVVLTLIFVPNCSISLVAFLVCSLFLMMGICLFNIGSDMSLM